MLNNVKKNIRTSFPFLKQESELGYSQEVFDTIQTMNISQTLNFSILLILMETINLISYVIIDMNGRLFSPASIGIVLFLLFMAGNLFYCDHLLQMDRTPVYSSFCNSGSACVRVL